MPSVTIDTTVDIDASRDAVWHVLTDFPRYDEWSPSLRIAGTPEVGEHFFVLTSTDDVTTRLHHGERFSGVLVALPKGGSGNGTGGYEAVSQALKHRVEQRRHGASVIRDGHIRPVRKGVDPPSEGGPNLAS